MKIITIEDDEKYLRQISKEVDINDPNLENEIKLLKESCKRSDVLALAAVQVGILKRLIYLKNTNLEIVRKQLQEMTKTEEKYDEARVLINPVITYRKGLTQYWESCASCLDNMGLVKRPYEITVEYQDIKGNTHSEIFEGFESTVLSHEMDHLDGILHMDVAEKVLVMKQEDRIEYRKTHDYEVLSKTGNYEELKKKWN